MTQTVSAGGYASFWDRCEDRLDLVRWWGRAPTTSKTGLLVLMLEQVAVYPAASKGSRTVDGDRVALRWRVWDRAAA